MRRGVLPAWLDDSALLLEAFIAVNLAFLTLDIYVAHSVNDFRHPAEWIPFGFSIVGALAVAANLPGALRYALSRPASAAHPFHSGAGRWTGLIVGWTSIAVGVAGLIWHLQSHFFRAATLKNLVYSAPFIAPLAYTGIGLLLLVNRLVPHRSRGWARWVLFLAWGGFLGNFGLSLLDHAQNGFYYWTEWIAVVVSAVAVGFVLMLIPGRPNRLLLGLGAAILGLQAITGMVGLGLHLRPLLQPSPAPLLDRIVHGAPVFAPLLFVNLALLAAIGVWHLWVKNLEEDDGGRSILAPAPGLPAEQSPVTR
jgi:hypothetical protein